MPDRIIKESIKRSKTINELSPFEETCFYRLLVTVDDYGRFYRDPLILKSELFPRKYDLTVKSIDDAFVSIERVSLIKSYWVGDEQYLEVTTWGKHQRTRATKSKFPAEDGSITRLASVSRTIDSDSPTIDSKFQTNDNDSTTLDNNGCQMSPNSNANSKTKTKTKNTRARESSSSVAFISDDEALGIQDDQNEVLDYAEHVGFAKTPYNRDEIIKLFAEFGKENMMYALGEAGRLGKPSVAYITSVLKNSGKKTQDDDDDGYTVYL